MDGSLRAYRTMGVIRSAISSVATIGDLPAGQHRFVRQFMRAVFNEKPALPRYSATWDPDLVLSYLRGLGPNDGLSLLALSQKLCVLMLLLSGQRGQSMLALNLDNMVLGEDRVSFRITSVLKTTRPGSHLSELVFPSFPPDDLLCPVVTLRFYLQKTATLRGGTRGLFIISRRPFSLASRATISRWVRTCLGLAGIDVSIFAAGSTRMASSSKASLLMPLDALLAAVGWSQGSTFAIHYGRPIRPGSFAGALMGNFV